MLIPTAALDRRCDVLLRRKVLGNQREREIRQIIARGVPVRIETVTNTSKLLSDILGFSAAADLTFTMNGPHRVRAGYALLIEGKSYTVTRVDYHPDERRMEYQTGTLAEGLVDA